MSQDSKMTADLDFADRAIPCSFAAWAYSVPVRIAARGRNRVGFNGFGPKPYYFTLKNSGVIECFHNEREAIRYMRSKSWDEG